MSDLDIQGMLNELCRAAERRDGKAFASHFSEDGVYHDYFYGAFLGRERVAELISDWLYKDARDFRWDMIDPVFEAGRLYVRYVFSYNSTLPEADGARAMFEGVSIMTIRDGKITQYREVADTAPALVAMNFHPDRIFKIFSKKASALRDRPEAKRHLATNNS